MPETVPDEPRGLRSVGNWVLRILPLLVLLALMGWGAVMIVHMRENPACEPATPEAKSGNPAGTPGPVRCP
jgi:hypothetical protein